MITNEMHVFAFEMNHYLNHFDAKATLYVKGIALCLLLWHHLFYQHPEYGYFVWKTACLSKVCVAVFVMLSGYGLSASSSKCTPINFYRIRLSKLYIGFWCVFALFVPISWFVFNRGPYDVFSGNVWVKFCFQLAGLQQYYGGYGFNPTWWFMSVIIPLYLLFPILERMARFKLGSAILVAVSCAMLFVRLVFPVWMLPFVIGILVEKHNVFIRVKSAMEKYGPGVSTLLYTLAGALIIWGRQSHWFLGGIRFDSLFSFWIILGCTIGYPLMARFKLERVFTFVGRHSMNVFLFHTFLYYYWFPDFFYGFKRAWLIFVILLTASLATSVALEWCKRVLCVSRLEQFIREFKFERIKRYITNPR